MRKVILDAVVFDTDAGTVFENVAQFKRYVELSPHVQATEVTETRPSATGASSWELLFRSGLLQWSETERFLKDRLRIEFEQTEGDFDTFTGHWALVQQGADTEVHFECDFDFGIESLEGILDPIAERVIKETVAWAVVGLHERVRLAGDLELVPTADGATTPS
ncbi:ribosome-associated toxin RatA of RatAB toxin-antitoxin module [Kitasatospora sp. MAA4]|uniref:type II toxin-antitoxin system RatA family toxin n=1 Tax=Kitasatospora sp. MAA4 TaxID=3035093 RepID=UPI002473CB8A|nr:SRPBCC family protein [Kitasatospora sp. MAA4]MDH6135458.1 ribosome-associated toxin RatA of RatAB toxin-antitoxin module [Kitasatospora sp. MAA4]